MKNVKTDGKWHRIAKGVKVYTIEGKKFTINDLYIRYTTKWGYPLSGESIKKNLRLRLKKDAMAHRKHILSKILAY